MPPPPSGRQEASPGDQRAPHTPPPPPHPPQLGNHGRGPPPPRSRGGNAVGGAAAGPAPASPHWRARATRTTEQYGGRAPHDPPVTSARSGRAEGGFRSARAPGGAVRGPPLTPPHPGAALRPRPQAHAGRERAGDTKGARIEYRRPPPRRGAGRPRRDTPPPPPQRPAGRWGPGPHAQRQGGWSPPARERSRSDGLILRVLDAFRPRGGTWSGQVISSPPGPSGAPSKRHLLPGGGVPRVHRARSPVLPRLPRFATPRSVHQFPAVAAGAYPPRRPPQRASRSEYTHNVQPQLGRCRESTTFVYNSSPFRFSGL